MKFKLQATHDDGTVVTHEFEEDVWYAALDGFVKFLRGNGYFVSDKSVGINLKAGHYFYSEDEPYHNITFFEQEKE